MLRLVTSPHSLTAANDSWLSQKPLWPKQHFEQTPNKSTCDVNNTGLHTRETASAAGGPMRAPRSTSYPASIQQHAGRKAFPPSPPSPLTPEAPAEASEHKKTRPTPLRSFLPAPRLYCDSIPLLCVLWIALSGFLISFKIISRPSSWPPPHGSQMGPMFVFCASEKVKIYSSDFNGRANCMWWIVNGG